MSDLRNPFDSIESAQEFMGLLSEAIEEAIHDVADDRNFVRGQERRLEALNLALYKLKSLEEHVDKSRRLLKDLRSIRRILVGERPDEEDDKSDDAASGASARIGI